MGAKRIYILSGGAGTRLWPLSRESYPKQFYDLAQSGKPLLVDTCQRLAGFGKLAVLTTQALKFASMGVLQRFKIDAEIVGEPSSRNTAPAVALATLQSLRKDPSSLIGIFPADHLISNLDVFQKTLNYAFDMAQQGQVVTIGIHPTYASTAYGYLEIPGFDSKKGLQSLKVSRFIEKPNAVDAEKLLSSGQVVWNGGIFVFSAKMMSELFASHMPELWSAIQNLKPDESNLNEIYSLLPKQSIDYGIMEKAKNLYCVPAMDLGWSDIGSWEDVAKKSEILGGPISVVAKDNFYTGVVPSQKRVAFVGVSDVIVVDTPDALLVTRKGEGQKVREVVEKLKAENSPLPLRHEFEDRPWGRFEVLIDSPHFKSKKISMWPNQRLSYQSHNKRAEHWVIVRGSAEVTLDDKVHQLKAGEHIYIPLKAKHRIANPTSEVMEFIEVQTGSYFGEDDIIRYQDDYGRN